MNIGIGHCGGMGVCATCHVEILKKMDCVKATIQNGTMENLAGILSTSRTICQIRSEIFWRVQLVKLRGEDVAELSGNVSIRF